MADSSKPTPADRSRALGQTPGDVRVPRRPPSSTIPVPPPSRTSKSGAPAPPPPGGTTVGG